LGMSGSRRRRKTTDCGEWDRNIHTVRVRIKTFRKNKLASSDQGCNNSNEF
jgi:hypothetical protein